MKLAKRIVSIVVLACILLASTLAFCGSAVAADQDKSYAGRYYVNTTSPSDHTYSYIYSKPSSSEGKNLGRVNDGEQVYVYWVEKGTGKKSTKWAYCEYDGTEGYIRWSNLSTGKPDPKPTKTAKPTNTPKPTNTAKPPKPYGTYVQTLGNANFREGAGTVYASKGVIPKGSILEYLDSTKSDDSGTPWYNVSYEGDTGWVSSKYAILCDDPYDPDEPKEERIYCEGWYTVDTVTPADYTYSYIYDQPSSSNGKNLGRVNDGEQVYAYWRRLGIGSQNTYWAYCKYNGKEGYIRWNNLIADEPEIYYVLMTGDSNLREGPTLNDSIIGVIYTGMVADYLNASATDDRGVVWYYVRYNGMTGWVSSTYAEMIRG